MKAMRLGDMLVSLNLITEEQLQQALNDQKETHKRLGEQLIAEGYITEAQLIDTLRVQLGIDYIDLSKTDIDPTMSRYVPKALAKKSLIVPVQVAKGNLFLAMADPLNFFAIEDAQNASKLRIIPMIASSAAVEHAISVLYGNEGAAEAIAQMREEAGITDEQINNAVTPEETGESGPTIRLVNSIIERAHVEHASDIHIEPTKGDMVIRMRIDGTLHKILTVPRDIMDSVISRIKIMSRLDIVERRVPQDGRAVLKVKGVDVDMRVSTLPTIYGEKIVIRILGSERSMLNRSAIGMPENENRKLDRLLGFTSGVIMIVGPTGSGKSSTMYTLVQELLSEATNLITLEDPVEYNIDGATQVQINEKVGLTFASGLRAILRQDPDIICVGEIRDGETADIAMRAAMTGHLVITTIHTEDAVSAIDRLHDMGVPPYLVAGGVRGIISQRLVKRVCKNCTTEYMPAEEIFEISGLKPKIGQKYLHGKGCDFCFGSGYRGRIGVFEVLCMNDRLRKCVTSGGDKQEFRALALETDYVPMLDHAAELVDKGITTVEEVARVINLE